MSLAEITKDISRKSMQLKSRLLDLLKEEKRKITALKQNNFSMEIADVITGDLLRELVEESALKFAVSSFIYECSHHDAWRTLETTGDFVSAEFANFLQEKVKEHLSFLDDKTCLVEGNISGTLFDHAVLDIERRTYDRAKLLYFEDINKLAQKIEILWEDYKEQAEWEKSHPTDDV